MKRILVLIGCLSLLPVPQAQAGKAGAWIGGAAIGSLGTLAIQSARRPRYERPVEVREVHYTTTVPVQTIQTVPCPNAQAEVRRLQRELNAALDENRQLNNELDKAESMNRELQLQNREALKQLNQALDVQTDLQLQLKRKDQEIQKLQREVRRNADFPAARLNDIK